MRAIIQDGHGIIDITVKEHKVFSFLLVLHLTSIHVFIIQQVSLERAPLCIYTHVSMLSRTCICSNNCLAMPSHGTHQVSPNVRYYAPPGSKKDLSAQIGSCKEYGRYGA